ncbi:hypothetical protein BDW66DRAFT_126709 [Aspergillus desertorum]
MISQASRAWCWNSLKLPVSEKITGRMTYPRAIFSVILAASVSVALSVDLTVPGFSNLVAIMYSLAGN